jgi:hypothetical protein
VFYRWISGPGTHRDGKVYYQAFALNGVNYQVGESWDGGQSMDTDQARSRVFEGLPGRLSRPQVPFSMLTRQISGLEIWDQSFGLGYFATEAGWHPP